ncbi:DUF742 domain-containing protein [Actinomadura monticuli]|uniref:DUF742 domain-containing protein n=1 Tax=Actinomadura monticuli TaxID=3097367 RepID=A0ABV4QF76_9ACTN
MDSHRERWVDADAGPLVRPYAITRGRTRPRGERLDIVSILAATGRPVPEAGRLPYEQERILALCRRSRTPADLASDLGLPFGVVAVLVGDLIELGLLTIVRDTANERPDLDILRRIRDELRAL